MASNIGITDKNEKQVTHIIYMPEALSDKVTGVTDETVVQCDIPVVKNTSLDDDHNNDCK